VEKVIALVWGPGDAESGDALRHQLQEDTLPRLRRGGARAATFNVHDSAADRAPSPAPAPPGEQPHVAEISMWLDCYERTAEIDDALAALRLTTASYLVVESLYEDYGTTPHAPPRDWPDGERSPGVLTVALIHRPEGLDYREWITRWHGTTMGMGFAPLAAPAARQVMPSPAAPMPSVAPPRFPKRMAVAAPVPAPEIAALVKLHELGADLGEPVEMVAASDGAVAVICRQVGRGRETEIRAALAGIPKVTVRSETAAPADADADRRGRRERLERVRREREELA